MREIFARRFFGFFWALLILTSIQACAPRPAYRRPQPVASLPAPQTVSPPQSQPSEAKPILEQSRIREEDLREKVPVPPARVKDQGVRRSPAREARLSLPDEGSLLAKITPQTPPQRAASLRVTEEGKRLLEHGEYAKALDRLEKTIAIDSTNPYGYYYLAQAHHHLAHYQESLNFLDVAETLFSGHSYWLAEVFALKGENFRALGLPQRADSSYTEALRWNPGNRMASEGLSRLRGEMQPSLR